MEYTEIFEESLLKNLGEFVEFCVYDLKVNNYYDLIDKKKKTNCLLFLLSFLQT